MRVLAVTNMYPSAERPFLGTFVGDQVESLRALGHEVDVLTLPRQSGGMGVYRGLADRVTARTRQTSPDLVHVMYGGVMADRVARAGAGVPLVISFCGSDLLGGHTGGVPTRVRERVGVLASRRAAPRADGVIVKSAALRAALPTSLDPERVWTIPNGVDVMRFAPLDRHEARAALGWPLDDRVVLFPAAPSRPEKRFATAQAAVEVLRRTVPGTRLVALDRVPHADVPRWLNAADVVLLTSSHEGSPNAVKEALACCTPVVSVDVGDVRERIDGIPGCAVVARDPVSLALALDAAFAAPRSEEGRARMADLSLDRVAARIVDVYQEVTRRS